MTARDIADYDDFVQCLTGHAPIVELLNGRFIFRARHAYAHEQFCQSVSVALDDYMSEHESEGQVLTECEIVLNEHTLLYPDIALVIPENPEERVTDIRYQGVPTLVCEIIAKDFDDAEWQERFLELMRAGVREYWYVAPDAPPGERFTIYLAVGPDATVGRPRIRRAPGHDPSLSRYFPDIALASDLL